MTQDDVVGDCGKGKTRLAKGEPRPNAFARLILPGDKFVPVDGMFDGPAVALDRPGLAEREVAVAVHDMSSVFVRASHGRRSMGTPSRLHLPLFPVRGTALPLVPP